MRHFGLPLSFTTYELTEDFLIIREGLFTSDETQIKLFKITDVHLRRTLFDRLLGLGSIELFTTDSHDNVIFLKSIKTPSRVRDLINKYSLESVKRNRITQNQMFTGNMYRGEYDNFISDKFNDDGDDYY